MNSLYLVRFFSLRLLIVLCIHAFDCFLVACILGFSVCLCVDICLLFVLLFVCFITLLVFSCFCLVDSCGCFLLVLILFG